jgi:hypothetical protein
MYGARKKPFSSKQKKEQLKLKREQARAQGKSTNAVNNRYENNHE